MLLMEKVKLKLIKQVPLISSRFEGGIRSLLRKDYG